MALTFDFTNNLIEVDYPQTEVDIQALIDSIRDAEESEEGIQYDKIADASGKESLGSNVNVGITVELLGNWQLHFWEGNYIAKVAGGNLVGGPGGDPIAYSSGVQVLLIQSAASTIVVSGSGVTQDDKDDIINGVHAMLGSDIDFIKSIEGGRWKRVGHQMVFYDADNATEIARFNLLQSDGTPAGETDDVYERVRV